MCLRAECDHDSMFSNANRCDTQSNSIELIRCVPMAAARISRNRYSAQWRSHCAVDRVSDLHARQLGKFTIKREYCILVNSIRNDRMYLHRLDYPWIHDRWEPLSLMVFLVSPILQFLYLNKGFLIFSRAWNEWIELGIYLPSVRIVTTVLIMPSPSAFLPTTWNSYVLAGNRFDTTNCVLPDGSTGFWIQSVMPASRYQTV